MRFLAFKLAIALSGLQLLFWADLGMAREVLHEKPDQMSWPPATIEQVSWLAGTWRGRADDDDGVEVVESWVGPAGTMMAGVALQTAKANGREEESQWSEHMAILSNGYTLALHFGTVMADFTEGSFEQRRLLRIEDNGCELYFHAVTYKCERHEETREITGMVVFWKEPKDEWNPEPELFTYRYTRVK